MTVRANPWLIPALVAALVLSAALSLLAGKVWIAPAQLLAGDERWPIIAELRLPRVVLALLIGGGLGMAGAAMQGYLRNPLADPGLFGVSATAALGAVISIFFGLAATPFILSGFSLAGAALAVLLLSIIAGQSGSIIVFTLAGVVISSLAGALTALVISLAPTPFATGQIVNWLMGALTDRSWDEVTLAAPLIIAGMVIIGTAGRSLDALTLGEAAARSLGVRPAVLQAQIIIGVGLVVGAGVAAAGIIGFVGLIVPHLIRPFTNRRPSAVLVPAALAGALLLLLADSAVRAAPTVSEVRLGIAMSLLGAPFFLALLISMRRKLG
ncbi:MAG: FecCD family ABC transporter permease [Erythrobacter sp.]